MVTSLAEGAKFIGVAWLLPTTKLLFGDSDVDGILYINTKPSCNEKSQPLMVMLLWPENVIVPLVLLYEAAQCD